MASIIYVLTVIPVSDLEKSIEWYEVYLGRAPDQRPMEGVAEWQVREGAWLQLSTGMEAVGGTTFALAVDDLEKFRAQRIAGGLELGEIVDYGIDHGVVRMAEAKDPDGNDVSALQEAGEPV